MQVKKDQVKQKILDVAKHSFREKSYREVTLTEIAKRAGISRGAIYPYFKDKRDIFHLLCKDAIDAIDAYFKIAKKNPELLVDSIGDLEKMKESFDFHMQLVETHREGLDLLLFHAAGSEYENYRAYLIEQYVNYFYGAVLVVAKDSALSGESGKMVIRTLASSYLSYIEQLVLCSPESELIKVFNDKMTLFIFNAIKLLLQNYKTDA